MAHVVHNMRNIDYEISVYSDLSSAVLGYRLVFLAESGDGHNYELVREIYMYGTCWWCIDLPLPINTVHRYMLGSRWCIDPGIWIV